MKTDLKFTDVTPEDDTKYKHNSESETNSPYIVVGTFEGLCPSNTFESSVTFWLKASRLKTLSNNLLS